METEETVKEECVAMSKTKRIWLAFVDIVLFTVLFMIFLFLFAIPFAIAFPELKTQAGGMSVYLMMLNEVLMLASGLIAACMVLGFRKLPFSGLLRKRPRTARRCSNSRGGPAGNCTRQSARCPRGQSGGTQ